jgi:hypothetical protein
MQAQIEGGLSERAKKTATRLAATSDARQTPPRDLSVFAERPQPKATKTKEPVVDPRLPPPGNWVERQYKGRMVSVMVLETVTPSAKHWFTAKCVWNTATKPLRTTERPACRSVRNRIAVVN